MAIKYEHSHWRNAPMRCLSVLFIFMACCLLYPASAVQPISGILAAYDDVTDDSDDYSAPGGGSGGFPSSNTYDIRFNVGNQNNLWLSGFEIGAEVFNFVLLADIINIERVDNATISGNHHIILFEQTGVSGTDVDLKTSATFTMEEALRSPIVNRGADNVFANQGDGNGNNNNIQRIDYIFPDGFPVFNNIHTRGFLIMDRGGNDRFRIAAITGLDTNGLPNAFMDPITVMETDWGESGITLDTVVMRGYTEDGGELRPSANVTPQPLAGVFVSWETLGLETNDFIYGYSLAAADVTLDGSLWTEVDDPDLFPQNTSPAATLGGLDLISGGMMFFESQLDVTVGDFVWDDWNGNGIQDPGEPGLSNVLVHVYDVNTNLAAVTRTDSNGFWLAQGIGPGDFFVEYFLPDDYQFTVPFAGTNTAVDSNADPVTGRSDIFSLVSGETNRTIDAGMHLSPSDLRLDKSVTPLSANHGDTIVYSLSITNVGPETVDLVQVTDPLPAAVSFTAYGATMGAYDDVTGIWNIGELLVGATASLTITGSVNSGFADSVITNVAEITRMNRPDTNLIDNVASASFRIEGADLGVTKTADWDTPVVGLPFTYSIFLTNSGPDMAQAIEITDNLPSSVTYSNSLASQGIYDPGTGIWDVGDLANGDVALLEITVFANEGTSGFFVVTNRATVTDVIQEDPNPDNNEDEAIVTVCGPNITVLKSVDRPAVNEGDTVWYTITALNNCVLDATGVEVTDPLATGLTYVSNQTSQGTYDPISGIWTVGSISPGDTAELLIEATIDAGTMGTAITNTAALTASDFPDPFPDDDEDSAIVFVSSLGIEKTSDVIDFAAPGDTITYTIVVTNSGAFTQTGVNVNDLLPPGTVYVPDSATIEVEPPFIATAPEVDLRLQYFNNETDVMSQQIGPWLRIFNDGTNDLAFTDITLRYWFTSEPSGTDTFFCDWAQIGAAAVTHEFGTINGEYYVEIGFTSAAEIPSWDGGLGSNIFHAGGETGEIQTRIHDSDWELYDQSDDFSWDPSFTSYADYDRITLYYQGQRVWGLQPSDFTSVVFNTSGAFVVPTGITNLTVQAWGGGGGGAASGSNDGGGGGGGGAYARIDSFSVTPLSSFDVVVGTGGPLPGSGNPGVNGTASWFDSTNTLFAAGGQGGGTPNIFTGGSGGAAVDSIGDITFSGGNGGIGHQQGPPTERGGGGGGGSAFSYADGGAGGNGARETPGIGGVGHGEGGSGGYGGVVPATGGEVPGGGGGGCAAAGCGTGADGQVIVTYQFPVTFGAASGTTNAPPNIASNWTLEPGSILTITFQVTVDNPIVATQLVNTASVTTDQEPIPLTDTATDPLIHTDLAVFKSVSNDNPEEADLIAYTIVVTNNGPVNATGVVIEDILPTGVTFDGASASQGTYDSGSGLWTVGAVDVGEIATLTLSVTVDVGTAGSIITNTASLFASDVADSDPTNNEDSAVITVLGVDIGVGKHVVPAVNYEQEQLIFTITATNFGPNVATGVEVTDVLPAGVTYVSHTASQGTYNSGTGIWEIGSLAVLQAESLAITAEVDVGTAGQSITNVAAVTAVDQIDYNPDNDEASVVIFPELAPLDITKEVSPTGSVPSGATLTYTIVVTNSSAQTQTGVSLTDLLPPGVTYVTNSTQITFPVSSNITFRDEFNVRSYAQNNGTADWTGNWIEAGESDGPLAGNIQILFDPVRGQSFSLRMAGGNRALAREADLGGFSEALLSFDYRRQGLGAGEFFAIQVSPNGIGGPWTELDRFEGPGTDSAYLSTNYNISAWIATNTAIRFVSTVGSMDISDIVWFDDVEISIPLRLPETSAGGAPPNLASGHTLEPGETLIATFDVIVDQPGSHPELVNLASTISDLMTMPRTDTAITPVDLMGVGIGNRVWFDANGNGIQDVGETNGIANVPVTLMDTNGNVVATTSTDVDGLYLFEDMAPGTYRVRFDLGSVTTNITISPPYQGGDETIDSNAIEGHGGEFVFTDFYLFSEGETNTTIDVGLRTFGPTRADIADVWGEWVDGAYVVWETSAEVGTAGFFVYRIDSDHGTETRLNATLLPSTFKSDGDVYRLLDPDLGPGESASYRIEEVELMGTIRDLGDYNVTFGEPRAPVVAPMTRTVAFSEPVMEPLDADPSDCLKVMVSKDGIYRVRIADVAAGMARTEAEVRDWATDYGLALVAMGASVPYHFDATSDSIIFYGRGADNWYAREMAYWITPGEGQPFVQRDPGSGAGTAVFPVTVRFEEDRYPFSSRFPRPEDFYYWKYIVSGNPDSGSREFILDLGGYTGGSVDLRVQLVGWSETGYTPDHLAEFELNGVAIGSITFDNQEQVVAELVVPPGVAVDGNNVLTVRGVIQEGHTHSFFVLDWIEVAHDRALTPSHDTIHFTAEGAVSVSAFEEPFVLSLADVNQPVWVTNEDETLGAGVWVAEVSDEPFALIDRAAIPTLDPIAGACSAWFMASDNRIDYLVITSRALQNEAEELAAYRESMGLRTGVAVFEDICDLFTYGVRTPEAIPELLRYAADQWAAAPWLVVLAGHGHYDYFNAITPETNHLPPLLAATPHGLFASDGLLTDLNGNGVANIPIGRLPARTGAELLAMLSKIQSYEAGHGQAWQQQIVLASDVPDGAGDFVAASDEISLRIPSNKSVAYIKLDQVPAHTARQQLMAHFNSGAGIIHYTGHGGLDNFSGQRLLRRPDVQAMRNQRAPLVIALSCLVGRFETPGTESLGELLIRHSAGGAAAVWSPSGHSIHHPATELGTAFYHTAFEEGSGTLGAAILRAHQSMPTTFYSRDTLVMYNLLGCPAMKLSTTGTGHVDDNRFAQWRWERFTPEHLADASISAADAVPADGFEQNILAYAFGNEPGPGDSHYPAIESFEIDGDSIVIRWHQRRLAQDLEYRISITTDLLGTWGNQADILDILAVETVPDSVLERVTARIPFVTDRLYVKLDVIAK